MLDPERGLADRADLVAPLPVQGDQGGLGLAIGVVHLDPHPPEVVEHVVAHRPRADYEVVAGVQAGPAQDGPPHQGAVQPPQPLAAHGLRDVPVHTAPGLPAEGDAILVLNPDTELHPGALQALAAHLEANPACGPGRPPPICTACA